MYNFPAKLVVLIAVAVLFVGMKPNKYYIAPV